MLITLKEWAIKVGIDPATARQRANRGTVPAVKMGRDWMIEEDTELIDYRKRGEKMKIKTYNSNWEVWQGEKWHTISTDGDYINNELYESVEDVAASIVEELKDNGFVLSKDDILNIEIECEIHFSSRF